MIVFISAFLISGGFIVNDFINRGSGMPLNAWYGFINSLILGLGLIGLVITDKITGLNKSNSYVAVGVALSFVIMAVGFSSLYYQINY